jgi:hypothetical protein
MKIEHKAFDFHGISKIRVLFLTPPRTSSLPTTPSITSHHTASTPFGGQRIGTPQPSNFQKFLVDKPDRSYQNKGE